MRLKQVVAATIAATALVGVGFWFGGAMASTTEPGSTADPLVSKSYVDQALAKLADKAYVDAALAKSADKAYVDQALATAAQKAVDKAYVDQAVSARMAEMAAAAKAYTDGKTGFQVVNLPKGATLLAQSGTELVLRGGKAKAVVSEKGGVLDATGGTDLWQGASIPANHLLIIPVSDGRGMVAETDAILIVKGTFTVTPAPGQ